MVISTYSIDRSSYVLACIKSLEKQVLLPNEIFLVLDPDENLIEFYKSRVPRDVKIIVSEGYGLSNARNTGVKIATGEIITFIDDDAVAEKNWLKNLVINYDNPHVVGVGGHIRPLWENGRPFWFPEELDWIIGCSYKGFPDSKTFIRNPIGCNMSFKKQIFKRVGYFRNTIGRVGKMLIGSEEMEFSLRILEKIPRAKIIYDPSAIVYHMVSKNRTNLKYLIKRSFFEGVSKALISDCISNPSKVLSTEYNYLRHLLTVAIPYRLKRFYNLESFSQLLTLMLSVSFVLVGYFVGKFK